MKLLELFFSFFKIGAFTIGGGLAMVPLMEREVVRKKWITPEEIVDVFAISQSAPGVIAINSAIFIGYKILGLRGAIAAALGIIAPSFITILAIYYLFSGYSESYYVQKAFFGVRAGVVGLILYSAIKLAKNSLVGKLSFVLLGVGFVLLLFFGVSIPAMLLVGAAIGVLNEFVRR